MRNSLIILVLFLCSSISYGQKKDSLIFSKGRFITGLYGTLSNQLIKAKSGNDARTSGYSIGTKSGRFITNNWVLGVNFSLSKTQYNNEDINIDAENLLLGLWTRLYFAHKGSAALYGELSPYYAASYTNEKIFDGGVLYSNKEKIGKGFGLSPGIGFTYLINRNVGFGMTLAYPWTQINRDTKDLILQKTSSDNYKASQLQFSFNFEVYLDQFFF